MAQRKVFEHRVGRPGSTALRAIAVPLRRRRRGAMSQVAAKTETLEQRLLLLAQGLDACTDGGVPIPDTPEAVCTYAGASSAIPAPATISAAAQVLPSIEMRGDYILTAVSNAGTLGTGYRTVPGLIYDPTGAGSFDPNTDYVAPDIPFEGFSVEADGLVLHNNNETYSSPAIASTGIISLPGTAGYANYVRWTGATDTYTIANYYFFNPQDQWINIRTVITAIRPLTAVKFLRCVDPDPDVWTNGVHETTNTRGYMGAHPESFVEAFAPGTGRRIALYSSSPVIHNTMISHAWSRDPDTALAGTDDGNGDFTIGLGFDVGDMAARQMVMLDYQYVFAMDNLDLKHFPVAYDQSLTTNEDTPIDGMATATDPDGDALSYSVLSQPAHGSLRFQSDGTFTYTPSARYYGLDRFTFKASDGKWDSNTATVNITVLSYPPTDLSLSPSSIPENQPAGTEVGRLTTTDPDVGDSFTYTLVTGPGSIDNASFTISGDQILSALSFDYELKNSYSIRVCTTDSTGGFFEKPLTITVTDLDDPPTDLALSNTLVPENSPAGTLVGTLSTTDPDAGDTFTYTLTAGIGSADNASFIILGDQLQTTRSFDYEVRSHYSIRVCTTDSGGLFLEKVLAITVTNVNEAPTDVILVNSLVVQNQPSGTIVGPLASTDPDAGDSFTYKLVSGSGDQDNSRFTISGGQLLTAASFRPEDQSNYSIRVRTTDAGGLSFEKALAIHVANITLSNATVPENQPYGTPIGTLSCSKADAFTALSYTLVPGDGDDDNATFAMAGDQLVTAGPLNYEGRNLCSVRIQTSNLGVVLCEAIYPITITNVNESPTSVLLSGAGVPEAQPIGTTVARLSATDTDGDDTFTYSLISGSGDDDNASFKIRGDRLVTATTFIYAPGREYAVRIRATDAGGLSAEMALGMRGVVVFKFGLVDGRFHKTYEAADSDGDVASFNVTGGGQGSFWGDQIGLLDTTPKSVLSISIKKGKHGDSLFTIGDIVSDGPIKGINAKGVILTGDVLLNTLEKPANKSALSLSLARIQGGNILAQNLPIASLTVNGDISHSRITTSGSINKLTAASLLDSQILIGVAPDFEADFATRRTDFTNPSAKLASLSITGKKLPKSQPTPAYITNSNISAPTLGAITLANVPATSGPILHVQNDTGTLKLTHSKLTIDPMLSPGTWKTPGTRPTIWQVL